MDLATAQANLDAWLAAEQGLANNAAYTVSFPNGTQRTVTKQDSGTVRGQITFWHRSVLAYSSSGAGSSVPGITTPSFR